MIFMIIYALAIIAECYFVPMFLKYSWPKKCMKSLKYKMICSGLFMLSALCCMLFSSNYSSYTAFIFVGLTFGLVGDLLIHYPTEKTVINALGGGSFFIGHIFYILAFSRVLKTIAPEKKLFDIGTVAIILGFVAVFVIVAFAKHIKLGKFALPVLAYAIAITTMLVSATRTAFAIKGAYSLLITVFLGAVLFVLSDITITFLMFGGQSKNRPLKIFNIVTYFVGQILLGTSILFVSA